MAYEGLRELTDSRILEPKATVASSTIKYVKIPCMTQDQSRKGKHTVNYLKGVWDSVDVIYTSPCFSDTSRFLKSKYPKELGEKSDKTVAKTLRESVLAKQGFCTVYERSLTAYPILYVSIKPF